MVEDKGKEEEKFDLSPELEGYISLDEARVLALQHARDNCEVYGRYAKVELVVEVIGAVQTENFYEVTLSFLPPGDFQTLARGRWWAWCFVPVALWCSAVCSAASAGQCSAAGGSGGRSCTMPATSASCDLSAIAALVPMKCSWP